VRTLEQLEECESKCQEWHEEALKSLNEAQTVEYHRLVNFYTATKYWYKGILANSLEEGRRLNKERGYFWGLGFLFLLAIWYLSGSDSLELKVFVPLFLLLGFYNESNSKALDREIAAEIRKIDRDLSLTGVVLSVTYQIIQKENQIDNVLSSDKALDEDARVRAILEQNILHHYWNHLILTKVTNFKVPQTFPTSAYTITD